MTDDSKGPAGDADPARATPAQPVATTHPGEGSSSVNAGGTSADVEPAELRPISADMQQFIGRQLRAVFDDVAKQPIPDRFLELMKQLDNKTGHG